MRMLLYLTACLITSVLAVFPDEAYQVDYHHALLGFPQQQTTFFHQPYANSKASLIYTLSERGVIGAVNPKDGSLIWRQFFSSGSTIGGGFLKAGEGQNTVVSAASDIIAAWSASDGRLVWESRIRDGKIKDLEVLESNAFEAADGVKGIIAVIESGHTYVKRLDGKTGRTVWTYADESGDTPLKVSISSTNIFYVTLHKTMRGSLKIRVKSIDTSSGQEQRQQTISFDSEVNSADDVLFIGSNSAVPIVVWIDKSRNVLKMNILGTNSLSTFHINNGDKIDKVIVHAPTRLMSNPHFLIAYEAGDTSWAEVYQIKLDREQISKHYDLPSRSGKGCFAVSSYDADVYFTRVVKGGIEVYGSSSETAVARYTMADFGVHGLRDYPEPVHAVSEVMPRTGTNPAVRTAFLLASGDWVLNLNGEFAWSRPEALSAPSSAVIADLPLKNLLAQELATEAHSNLVSAYVHRLKRHVRDLEQLPDLIRRIPDLVINSVMGRNKDNTGMTMQADSYGFRKLAIVATDNGRLIAIDTGRQGEIAWNMPRPDSTADLKWQSIQLDVNPNGIGRMKTEDGTFLFDTTTGKFLDKDTVSPSKPPSGPNVRIQYALVDGELKGYSENHPSSSVWTFRPAPHETITAITARPSHDPVASIGKVLGDRSVLYKYLNPNAILVTATDETSASLSIYLLDTVSGRLLSEAHHAGVDVSRPIPAVISENWFCYSFTSGSSATASKGPQIVISELYESAIPNDRGTLGASNNYSALQPSIGADFKPYVISQSYHIPEEISDMAVSQTRQGITTRLLIAILPEDNSIIGIPRTALDPRRTVDRDPTSSEQMEGLTRYLPVLDFDPKWYLNHKREVHGIKFILSRPSVLESTSVIFAYGFDVFGTRISPSFSFDILGKEFNKAQMLITVAALAVGVLVVSPLVRRKQINMRWQIGL